MHSSFIAYIDESGDEGFHFKDDGRGSSRWFVLSAVVFRRTEERAGDIERLRAVQHSQLAGLQIADAVASSTFYAVNPSRFGITDPSYLHFLRHHVYRQEGAWLGFGVHFLSDFGSLKSRMPHLGAAFEDW